MTNGRKLSGSFDETNAEALWPEGTKILASMIRNLSDTDAPFDDGKRNSRTWPFLISPGVLFCIPLFHAI